MRKSYLDSNDSSIISGRSQSASLSDVEANTKLESARRYVNKMPAAVSGEGGHNATFRVACILTHKFKLGYEDALNLLLEFNERCEPPWSVDELVHKLDDASDRLENPKPKSIAKPQKSKVDGSTATKPLQSKPQLSDIRPFTQEDIFALSKLRRIPPAGIKLAAQRGFLFMTMWHEQLCFGVKDCSGLLIELRRMDGAKFPSVPEYNLRERKSHAIKGSNKSWLLGTFEAHDSPMIALVEGIPDFLYAHHRVVLEGAQSRVAVVAMLSANPAIDDAALVFLHDKTIRMFPHLDSAGLAGATRWKEQLEDGVAHHVDIFDLSGLQQRDGTPVNDLCDLTGLSSEQLNAESDLNRILP